MVEMATMGFAGPLFPDYLLRGNRGRSLSMPRIPDFILDGVVFLFRTEEEARKRARIGGSGFIIGLAIPGSEEVAGRELSIPYVISNRHVVFEGGASVVTVNRRDGNAPTIIPFEPTDWIGHPDGDDVAVICLSEHVQFALHRISHIGAESLLIPEAIKSHMIGVGDEVFMVGRFVNHQGNMVNRPAARFGSISMGLENIWVAEYKRWQESFAVEMRSRTGFSGSPVAIYRNPTTVLSADIPKEVQSFWGLLGINWGYILDEDGENTWLNGVVPAWKILEVLAVPKLREKHQELTDKFHRKVKKGGAVPSFAVENSEVSSDVNTKHREDFSRLLGEAARKRGPKD